MNTTFDDFDDDTGSYDRGPDDQIGSSGVLLRRAIDIIATAPNMPLSSTPRIDRDVIIEILEEALHRLPNELREARWMMKQREEFVARTRREADELIDAAKVQAERFVQRSEVVRAAEQRARQIVEAAEDESRRLKNETEDFLDQRLASFEILLDKLSKTVATGRRRLAIGETPNETQASGHADSDDGWVDAGSDESGAIFFDQDSTRNR
ncbi:MAG: hypothetical protein EBX99_07950 [Acidimicrobiia bacterium]|jgi:hypothetical protein|nr:hypothetical protein [Acidimicrobiia bacterium]NDF31293.1 hypothetical protein [Acidimicrobiia bacterium]NDH47762.1 hypothetical protein [Acidimicrobiia bacterium]